MNTKPVDKESLVNNVREKCPADKFRWSRMNLLTLEQALFLSYGIEPPDEQENPSMLVHYTRFLEKDFLSISKLSQNAVEAGILPLHDRFRVQAEDFVSWAKDRKIPIKTDCFYRSPSQEIHEIAEGDKKDRRARPEAVRKEIFRLAASLHWRKEAKEAVSEYTRPTELARKKEMKSLIDLVNKIGGLEPTTEELARPNGIDPEWFSDLYPGKCKPGPQSKKNK